MGNRFNFSQRSDNNLIGLHPDLVKIVRHALALSTIDFGITEGLRTQERQKQLLSEGKSQTMNSRHLTGHAVDVVVYLGKEITWDWPYYEGVAEVFKKSSLELAIPIEWGGDWKTLKDGVHFQLPHKYYP